MDNLSIISSKGRRMLGSDPSLVKLHDAQLKEVEESARSVCKANRAKDRSRSQDIRRSKENHPMCNIASPKATRTGNANKSQVSVKSVKKSESEHKGHEEDVNTTFLNELNLYMKQAKYSDDGSESDSTGSLKKTSDISISDLATDSKGSKSSKSTEEKHPSVRRLDSPPLSDISDETDISLRTNSTTNSKSDSNEVPIAKYKSEKKSQNVLVAVPKIEGIPTSEMDRKLVNKYLSECEGSVSNESQSSASSNSQYNRIRSHKQNNCTTKQLEPVNVPELTMMVQQIPRISTFDKNILALKNSESSCASKPKNPLTVQSFRYEIANDSADGKFKATDRQMSCEQKKVCSNQAECAKYEKGKYNYDRTTIKITNLSPEEMPSSMLKSMVEGVVAVSEPEFELQSTLRFPTKSLYILFKSEEAAFKAMEFLQNSNINCAYRTID